MEDGLAAGSAGMTCCKRAAGLGQVIQECKSGKASSEGSWRWTTGRIRVPSAVMDESAPVLAIDGSAAQADA